MRVISRAELHLGSDRQFSAEVNEERAVGNIVDGGSIDVVNASRRSVHGPHREYLR